MKRTLSFIALVALVCSGVIIADRRMPADWELINRVARLGILPDGCISTGEIADDAVTLAKMGNNSVSNNELCASAVTHGKTTTRVKTKTAAVELGSIAGTDEKYLFVAPVDCTLVSVGLVCDSTTSGSNAGTNWSFQVANLTISSNLLSSAKATSATELTGDAYYDLGADQHLALSANDVLEFQATSNGTPTSLSSAEVLGVVEYY